MAGYDQINKLKEKHKQEIDTLQERINKQIDKINSLESELKTIKMERYQDHRGKGSVDKLKDEVKKLQQKNAQLLDASSTNESFVIFSEEEQQLIKKIFRLTSKNPIYEGLCHKFKRGSEEILIIAKKIQKDELTRRDLFMYVFRDDLLSLLEKVLQVITGKYLKINSLVLKLMNNQIRLDDKFYKEIPSLSKKNIWNNYSYLIHLENHAFHGSLNLDKSKNDAIEFSNQKTDEFLNLSKKEKLETIWSLLKLIYYVFTCEDNELYLFNISQCWKSVL